jgi:hypothetical protein
MPLTLAPAAVCEPLPPLPPYDHDDELTTSSEAWLARRAGHDGLELSLHLPEAAALPDGPFRLSAAHRLQLVLALESLVGVSLDPPIRRELLADDALSASLRAGSVTFALDRTDGEHLFGAPMYHAWLAHQAFLLLRRDEPATEPGRARAAP